MTDMLVHHDPQQSRFEVTVQGERAELNYQESPEIVSITRTYVPDALRGKGLAGHLAEAALQWVEKSNKKVVSHCSYVDSYLERHSVYQKIWLR